MDFNIDILTIVDNENNIVDVTFHNPYQLEFEDTGPRRHHTRSFPLPLKVDGSVDEAKIAWLVESLTNGIKTKMYQDNGFVLPPKSKRKKKKVKGE